MTTHFNTQHTPVEEVTEVEARTANGAVTNITSGEKSLDLFFVAGASRNMSDDEIIIMFDDAHDENPELAFRVLQWARDVRGGAGERRFFKVIMKHLVANQRTYGAKNVKALLTKSSEIGRWRDLLDLFNKCTDANKKFIGKLFNEALDSGNGLAAKWLPRKGKFARAVRTSMGYKDTPKEYRRKIVDLTKVVETQMCQGKWDEINYSHVPSVAFKKYRKAFLRHDPERFEAFIQSAIEGETKVNAGAIFPHEILAPLGKGRTSSKTEVDAMQAQWQNLADSMENAPDVLPMIDVSASMSGDPMHIAVSLGMYLAERNTGQFKNAYMTFESRPQFGFVKEGAKIDARYKDILRAGWGGSTDLSAAFKKILEVAVNNNVPADHMPKMLLVLSDMEFDSWGNRGLTSTVKDLFKKAGYECPTIVFWNLAARAGNNPVKATDKDMVMVSGFSPAIAKTIMEGKDLSPMGIMLDAIMIDRYTL